MAAAPGTGAYPEGGPDEDASSSRIRSRLLTVAVDALGRLDPDQVPAPLRRVAGFARAVPSLALVTLPARG
ncbi:MAG: hypothetical protein M3Y66_07720 [Actinomycetota bacterium]|nr:hypothetical protein [Actinomycetota bacterium]